VWNSGSDITPLAPVHPTTVRIDGSLQDHSPGPDRLDLQPLLDRVAQVRAIGAEPLVILSYMPRWLGAPRAGTTHDATRMGPYDLDTWQALVAQVVRTLATAPEPAYRFEVWNEPDSPIFWQDTPEEFVATALRTHRAVAEVKQETGLPLEIGGPAAAFGLNAKMLNYLGGIVHADGTPKPTWWVFRAWAALTGDVLFSSGDAPASGLWARATRDHGCVSVLLANFVATGAPARTVALQFTGDLPQCRAGRATSVATLDTGSTSLGSARSAPLDHDHRVTVPMASQSVALVQVSCKG
jgi:hypothetical protein